MKTWQRLVITLASCSVFTPQTLRAATEDWHLQTSKIQYTVKFPLKTVHGESNEAKGKGRCESGQCQFLIAAPLNSFKSGDTNRDAHMLEATKGPIHPLVSARYTLPLEGHPAEIKAQVEIDFAGGKNTYKDVPVHLKWNDKSVDSSMDLTLILTKYAVERPTLLGVAIDDEVPLHIEGNWAH